jgi:hypothetical protein
VRAGHVDVDGVLTVEVRVTAPLPVIGLLGPSGLLTVSGHGAELDDPDEDQGEKCADEDEVDDRRT